MHAHAHAHLFGFSQVVATADAAAQALSTPPLTVPSSPPKKKDSIIQAHSFASINSVFFFSFLLSSLYFTVVLRRKNNLAVRLSYKRWIEVIIMMCLSRLSQSVHVIISRAT